MKEQIYILKSLELVNQCKIRFQEVNMLWSILILCISAKAVEMRYIEVGNRNSFPIWIQTLTNNNGPPLSNEIKRINPGGRIKYEIGDNGWAGRLWPKIGCDQNGIVHGKLE